MNLRVSFTELQHAAQHLDQGQTQIEEILLRLQRQIQQLVQDGFVTGKSSVAFLQSYEEFNTGANKMSTGLSALAGYLRQAERVLVEADQQLASALG